MRTPTSRFARVIPALFIGASLTLLAPTPATATIIGQDLVTCLFPLPLTDVGDAVYSPGITTTEGKHKLTISAALPSGCIGNEAVLDEIAAESKLGVKKTAAGGRLAIAGASLKVKLAGYGDCLGIAAPNDPDDTGEYPEQGTATITWLAADGSKVAKSAAAVTLTLGIPSTTLSGVITKGLGVGGTVALSMTLQASPLDDANGNLAPDFDDCAFIADPTAVGKLLDIFFPSIAVDM